MVSLLIGNNARPSRGCVAFRRQHRPSVGSTAKSTPRLRTPLTGEIVETNRPDRERELAAVEARVRKAQGSLDRYFQAFEEGSSAMRSVPAGSRSCRSWHRSRPGAPNWPRRYRRVSRASRTLPRSRSSLATSSGRYVAVPAGTEGCDASGGGRDQGPRPRSHPAGLPRPHSWTTAWLGAPGRN